MIDFSCTEFLAALFFRLSLRASSLALILPNVVFVAYLDLSHLLSIFFLEAQQGFLVKFDAN